MSIRPVDFNGMIQNTHEVGNMKSQENQKPVIQQENVAVTIQRETNQVSRQVNDNSHTSEEEFRFEDKDGDGTGYEGNKNHKKKEHTAHLESDGSVSIKNDHGSFDIKI